EGRLLAILDSGMNRRPPGRAVAIVAAVLAIAAIAPLAALRAQAQAQTDAAGVNFQVIIRDATAQKNHQILEQSATEFEQLRKFTEAQALREAALAIREQQSGQQSASYVEGLVKLGDLARQMGRSPESVAYYSKAVALGDRPEIVPALHYLGLNA